MQTSLGEYLCLKLKSTRNFPLRNSLQSKNKSNKKMRKTSLSLLFIVYRVQKYNNYFK